MTVRIFVKELRVLVRSASAWLIFGIIIAATGFGFDLSVGLYSEASRSAGNGNPLDLFDPVSGVFVPTMSWLYLLFTLLLPFICVPLLSHEKERATIGLLLQTGAGPVVIIAGKALAGMVFIALCIVAAFSVSIAWIAWGGSVPLREVLLLAFGYVLYGWLVLGLCLFCAAIFPATVTAAVAVVSVLCASWFLDLASQIGAPFLAALSPVLSLSRLLDPFERGMVDGAAIVVFVTGGGLFIYGAICLTAHDTRGALLRFVTVLSFCVVIIAATKTAAVRIDVSRNGHNSFPEAIERDLRAMPPVSITANLGKSDPRREEFKREILSKLHLAKRDIGIRYTETGTYGSIIFHLGNDSAGTYSTDPREVLPLLFGLAGIPQPPESETAGSIEGFPLVVHGSRCAIVTAVYVLFVPLLLLTLYTTAMRPVRREKKRGVT